MYHSNDREMLTSPYTLETFKAMVEAVVPGMHPPNAPPTVLTAGAADLAVHEYIVWELDHSLALFIGYALTAVPLATATAMMLDSAAVQLISSGQAADPPIHPAMEGGPFASLSPRDRIRTMACLEQLRIDLGSLPPPYKDDGGLVKFIIDYLNRGTMFGNYSEWSAYGTTRLNTPAARRLEYFPVSWRQVGYPGASLGYRALRGFLLTINHTGGGPSHV
ncbi:hypothetical protein [Paenibacillus hamazuiensis]|uniref:hypothetical protein n=1 Tax=Paenibacillus hamazuiensis TaxID=2936508 RepID=UPI00200E2BA5|nr:hypothetical protein [Paenibacillus hamazuiensis]